MPGFTQDPEEQSEYKQNLYKALLDNLNPILTMGESYRELSYRPTEEELKSDNSIDFGPEGQQLPKTLAGKLSRFTRKMALDPLYSGANALERAYKGEATLKDAAESALTAISGGSFGSGGSAVANAGPGWQSRTLDWLAGRLGKAPKQATTESWIAKAKQAGLPPDERETLESTIDLLGYKPKDRLGAEALSSVLEKQGNLPTLGIETKVLSQERQEKLSRAGMMASIRANRRAADTEDFSSEAHRLYGLSTRLHRASDEARPRWPQYNLDEVTSPREILYKQKGSTYKNPDIETHYPGELGEGLVWHQREGKLKFPEGESTHLTEQQSDRFAEYANYLRQKKDFDALSRGENDSLRSRWVLESDDIGAMRERLGYDFPNVEDMSDNRVRSMFRMSYGGLGKSREVPKPPLEKDWYKTGFKDLVNRAVKEDSKFISWDSAAVQKKRWPAGEGTDKFFDSHYDQRLVNFAKKEYGVTPEKVNVPTKVMGKVTLISERGENIERPTNSLTMWRAKPEEAPGENLRWAVGDPDFGTYSHYGTYQEAKDALDWLIRRGVETQNNEVWRIPVTEEMKRKVLLEGQYFSKKDDFSRPYDIG